MWLVFQQLHRELRRISIPYTGTQQFHNWLLFYQNPSFATTDDAISSLWQTSLIDESALDDLKASVIYTESRSAEVIEDETIISNKLRQIMQSVDLDEVTSRDIRKQLQDECTINLPPYKDFIDRSILHILGQMEKPSKIFDYLYLGTEWNAANFDELERNVCLEN
jgi:protein phosphatase slingshot